LAVFLLKVMFIFSSLSILNLLFVTAYTLVCLCDILLDSRQRDSKGNYAG
jgi:hypothetical protein